eukprot:6136349-Amphidinium_carterae.1
MQEMYGNKSRGDCMCFSWCGNLASAVQGTAATCFCVFAAFGTDPRTSSSLEWTADILISEAFNANSAAIFPAGCAVVEACTAHHLLRNRTCITLEGTRLEPTIMVPDIKT